MKDKIYLGSLVWLDHVLLDRAQPQKRAIMLQNIQQFYKRTAKALVRLRMRSLTRAFAVRKYN